MKRVTGLSQKERKPEKVSTGTWGLLFYHGKISVIIFMANRKDKILSTTNLPISWITGTDSRPELMSKVIFTAMTAGPKPWQQLIAGFAILNTNAAKNLCWTTM